MTTPARSLPSPATEQAQAREHGLCTYPLSTLGWRYAGGLTVQAPFEHSNGQLGVYIGDGAGYLDEQPLLGRPGLMWVYDERADTYGPFVYREDAEGDDIEHLVHVLTETIGGDPKARADLDVLRDEVPPPTVCGYPAVIGPGTDGARCVVHASVPVLDETSDRQQRAKVEKVIQARQVSETTARELLQRQETSAQVENLIAGFAAR